MTLPRCWTGAVLALVYMAVAGFITQDEVRHGHGGWINLRGFGTTLVTAPSQVTLGTLLRWLRVPKVNYADIGTLGYAQLVTHVLVSAGFVYLLGCGIEWVVRRLVTRA